MRRSKEEAAKLVEFAKSQDHPESVWARDQAIVDDMLPEHYLKVFESKRDDYSDELPPVDINDIPRKPGQRNTRYKCQTNYLMGLFSQLEGVLDDEVIDDEEVRSEIELFISPEVEFRFWPKHPGNAKKLESVNHILDTTIACLKRKTEDTRT